MYPLPSAQWTCTARIQSCACQFHLWLKNLKSPRQEQSALCSCPKTGKSDRPTSPSAVAENVSHKTQWLKQKLTGSTRRSFVFAMDACALEITIQGSGARPTPKVGESLWCGRSEREQRKTDGWQQWELAFKGQWMQWDQALDRGKLTFLLCALA